MRSGLQASSRRRRIESRPATGAQPVSGPAPAPHISLPRAASSVRGLRTPSRPNTDAHSPIGSQRNGTMNGATNTLIVDDEIAIEPSHQSAATLLFTDIVGSTSLLERLGDYAWLE